MGKRSMKQHTPTMDMRTIQPSSPWHRWKRGEILIWEAVWESLPEDQKIETQ